MAPHADNPILEPRLLSDFSKSRYKNLLPHVDAHFILHSNVHTLNNYVLQQFPERTAWQFGAGVSAAELVRRLSGDIEKIRLYFYRLIELGRDYSCRIVSNPS